MIQILKTLFTRDLEKLKEEINLYSDEKKLWIIEKEISNSAGNLCLHLVGNLNYFIGTALGNTGYIRDRPLEFSLKDIPRSELVKMIEDTILIINQTLDALPEDKLKENYPASVRILDTITSIEFFLIHLTTHLAYHLGQINYHRRLLD